MNRAPRISFVSLGCPKALVDSERIVTRLRAEGYELAREHADADLAIVNTRGFSTARRRSRSPRSARRSPENGKVVVTGCMGAQPEQDHRRLSGTCSR
jgi:ribosomal protein S12 methylthiotransferase